MNLLATSSAALAMLLSAEAKLAGASLRGGFEEQVLSARARGVAGFRFARPFLAVSSEDDDADICPEEIQSLTQCILDKDGDGDAFYSCLEAALADFSEDDSCEAAVEKNWCGSFSECTKTNIAECEGEANAMSTCIMTTEGCAACDAVRARGDVGFRFARPFLALSSDDDDTDSCPEEIESLSQCILDKGGDEDGFESCVNAAQSDVSEDICGDVVEKNWCGSMSECTKTNLSECEDETDAWINCELVSYGCAACDSSF